MCLEMLSGELSRELRRELSRELSGELSRELSRELSGPLQKGDFRVEFLMPGKRAISYVKAATYHAAVAIVIWSPN